MSPNETVKPQIAEAFAEKANTIIERAKEALSKGETILNLVKKIHV